MKYLSAFENFDKIQNKNLLYKTVDIKHLKDILVNGILLNSLFNFKSGNLSNKSIKNYTYSSSFTRDKNYFFGWYCNSVRLVLNRDKIKQKYVLEPVVLKNKGKKESEERVLSDKQIYIKPTYIECVEVIEKDYRSIIDYPNPNNIPIKINKFYRVFKTGNWYERAVKENKEVQEC